jgi:hypothetical protein
VLRWLLPTFAWALPLLAVGNEIKWTEEVELHDGRVVQVKRRTELTASGFPAQRTGFAKHHELCYAPLGVYWRSKPEYRPETFDIIDGKVYVKVPVHSCVTCMLHDYPDNDALVMMWTGGGWSRVEEKDVRAPLRFNLLDKFYTGAATGLISLRRKKELDFTIYDSLKWSGRNNPYTPGICRKCQSVRSSTDANSEVFLPPAKAKCNW